MVKYECSQCGGPVPTPAATYIAQLQLGGPVYRGDLKPELLLCSRECGGKAARVSLSTKDCEQCGQAFTAERGVGRPGRPAVYCKAACRSARDRLLNRAMRRLARGANADPARYGTKAADVKRWMDDLQTAIDEAMLLQAAWSRRGSGAAVEPDAQAQAQLRAQIERLGASLNEAKREHVRACDREQTDGRVRDTQLAWGPRRRDSDWSDRLLAKLGETTDDTSLQIF